MSTVKVDIAQNIKMTKPESETQFMAGKGLYGHWLCTIQYLSFNPWSHDCYDFLKLMLSVTKLDVFQAGVSFNCNVILPVSWEP